MSKKKFDAGQIIGYLRAIEISLGKGKTAGEACREIGITEQAYYRWRKEYGGMQISQAKRLKDLEKLFPKAEEILGKVDILVNNAGITRDGLAMRMKDEDWLAVIDVNLTASFRLCRAAIKSMMKRRYGRIINISSVVGSMGNPGQANYCASKAGLVGMSKAIAHEVASRGITVNSISPGFIASAMTEVLNDTVKEKISSSIPMGRMGQPEEIANTVAFLASSEASYITGQNLHVNGGMEMV